MGQQPDGGGGASDGYPTSDDRTGRKGKRCLGARVRTRLSRRDINLQTVQKKRNREERLKDQLSR